MNVSQAAGSRALDPQGARDHRLWDGRRVLIVDDSQGICLLFSRLLEREGAFVTTAGSALGGINLALRKPCDLVLMDLDLPDLHGMEAAKRLRAQGYRGLLLAFSASQPDEMNAADLAAAGFDGALAKNGDALDIPRQLAAWLQS